MPRRSIRVQSGKGVSDVLSSILSRTGLMEDPPEYEGEKHVKGYNFLGPGTALEKRKRDENLPSKPNTPINKLDAAAKRHDYLYKSTNEKLRDNIINKKEAVKEIHNADEQFIEELKKIPDLTLTKTLASKAILLKKFGEQIGALPTEEFSLSGAGLIPPDNELRKRKRLGQRGGFLPALAGFITPIVASLAIDGVKALITHFTKKDKEKAMKGAGIKYDENMTLDEKKKYIAHVLDNMGTEQQINYMFKNLIKT